MLGYDSFTSPSYWTTGIGGSASLVDGDWFVLNSYAMRFHSGTRYATRSWMLVAALIGLGAFLTGQPRRNQYFFFPASVVFAAYAFRWAEVLTEMLMVEGILLGSPEAYAGNTAMEFWSGDRFTIIAYLLLGTAVVIGGVLSRRGWERFVASPPAPAMPAENEAVAAEELPEPKRTGENAAQGPTLATAPALT